MSYYTCKVKLPPPKQALLFLSVHRLLKPLPSFSSSPELRELAAIISRDIYQHNPNVKWEDVVELDDAKRLLKEAVVMPTKYPQIFTGERASWDATAVSRVVKLKGA